MAMSKKTKRNLAIGAGVAVAAAVGYSALKKEEEPAKKNGRVTRPPPPPGPGEPGGPVMPARGAPGGPPPAAPTGAEITGAGWARNENSGALASWYVFRTFQLPAYWKAAIVWPDGQHIIYDQNFSSGGAAAQYVESLLQAQQLTTIMWFPKSLWAA